MYKRRKYELPAGNRRAVYLLEKKGRPLYDEFAEEAGFAGMGKHEKFLLESVHLYMAGRDLQATQFKEIRYKRKNDDIPEWEFREKRLRVYCFYDEGDLIVAFGVVNKREENVPDDLDRLRRIKDEYFEAKANSTLQTVNEEGEIINGN